MRHITLIPRVLAAAFVLFTAPAAVLANDEGLPSDNRIKLLTYDENDVYRITTRYGYQTSLVFGPTEQVETISMGDRSVWQIVPNGNRLFIRPMDTGISTNMTILTNRHAYQFDLNEVGTKKSEVVYVARFRYPETEKLKPEPTVMDAPIMPMTPPPTAPSQPMSQAVPAPLKPQRMAGVDTQTFAAKPPADANFNYTYTGNDELAPFQVYDNGKSTYIGWKDMARPTPLIFIAETSGGRASGREFPTSYYVRDGYLVVDSVVPLLLIKQDGKTIRLYNETLAPAARAGQSGKGE